MREEGYYWVDINGGGDWEIYYFSLGLWSRDPCEEHIWLTDSQIIEIDERRITRGE